MEDWLRVELPLLVAGESSAGIYKHMYMTKMPYPFPSPTTAGYPHSP